MPRSFIAGFIGNGHLFEDRSIHDIGEIGKQKKLSDFMGMRDERKKVPVLV